MTLQFAIFNLTGETFPEPETEAWFWFLLDHISMIPSQQRDYEYNSGQFDTVGPITRDDAADFYIVNFYDDQPMEKQFYMLLINFFKCEDRRRIKLELGCGAIPFDQRLTPDVEEKLRTIGDSQGARIATSISGIVESLHLSGVEQTCKYASGNFMLISSHSPQTRRASFRVVQ